MGDEQRRRTAGKRGWQAMMRGVLVFALTTFVFAPRGARAFSDPAVFAEGVETGGGAGRFFTGSPHDGYTCNVCHGGGQAPDLAILGLPVVGYRPGTAYEVTIEWPHGMENLALEAELTDQHGMRAGSLRLPPEEELLPAELCLPVAAGIGAGMLTDLGMRTVISLPDCGAQRLRMLWLAPAQDVGPVWLTGSVVTSDAHGDVNGDGVTNFSRALPSPSVPDPLASQIRAGCNAVPAARTDLGVVGSALAWLMWRRRRVRRVTPDRVSL